MKTFPDRHKVRECPARKAQGVEMKGYGVVRGPPLSAVLPSVVSVTRGQPWYKNIK